MATRALLVAATALSLGYALVTFNFGEFACMPGLVVIEKSALLAFQVE